MIPKLIFYAVCFILVVALLIYAGWHGLVEMWRDARDVEEDS